MQIHTLSLILLLTVVPSVPIK